MFQIQYRKSVKKDLKKLSLAARRKEIKQILGLAVNPRPQGYKKLASLKNHYRIRTGNYRVIYSVEDNKLIIVIVRVGNRRDIYRNI